MEPAEAGPMRVDNETILEAAAVIARVESVADVRAVIEGRGVVGDVVRVVVVTVVHQGIAVVVIVDGLRETGFAATVFYVRRELALVASLGVIPIVVVDDLGTFRFAEASETRTITGSVPEAVHQALDALERECAGRNS